MTNREEILKQSKLYSNMVDEDTRQEERDEFYSNLLKRFDLEEDTIYSLITATTKDIIMKIVNADNIERILESMWFYGMNESDIFRLICRYSDYIFPLHDERRKFKNDDLYETSMNIGEGYTNILMQSETYTIKHAENLEEEAWPIMIEIHKLTDNILLLEHEYNVSILACDCAVNMKYSMFNRGKKVIFDKLYESYKELERLEHKLNFIKERIEILYKLISLNGICGLNADWRGDFLKIEDIKFKAIGEDGNPKTYKYADWGELIDRKKKYGNINFYGHREGAGNSIKALIERDAPRLVDKRKEENDYERNFKFRQMKTQKDDYDRHMRMGKVRDILRKEYK